MTTSYHIYAASKDEPTRRVHMYTLDDIAFADWLRNYSVLPLGDDYYADAFGATWWVKRYEDLPR